MIRFKLMLSMLLCASLLTGCFSGEEGSPAVGGDAALEALPPSPGTEAVVAEPGPSLKPAGSTTAGEALPEPMQIPVREAFHRIQLKNRMIDIRTSPALPVVDPGDDHQGIYLVHFNDVIRSAWVQAFEDAGLMTLDYIPMNAYTVFGSMAAVQDLAARLPEADWIGTWKETDKVSQRLDLRADLVDVSIYVVEHDGNTAVVDRVDSATAAILMPDRWIRGSLVLTRTIAAGELESLLVEPEVYWVEPWLRPEMNDEVQAQICAGNYDGASPTGPGYRTWLDSQPIGDPGSVIVDVCDSGLDTGVVSGAHHADFGSRIVYQNNYTSESDGDDGCGHGTINAAIVGGDATNGTGVTDSEGYLYGEGMAPAVKLGGSALFNDGGIWDAGSADYVDFVQGAYDQGASISTNSWGSHAYGDYTESCQAYDQAVRDVDLDPGNGYQQMIVFFSAGNDGYGSYSIGAPSGAKNVIAVGASENYRMNGTDGCGIPNSQADDLQDISSFTSRGPCDDGRMKPEFMAPGTHIQGAASSAASFDGDGVCDEYWPAGQTLYARSSGTSHACPAAAGIGALVYSWYQTLNLEPLSPAMMKAILVGHTADMAGGTDSGYGTTLGHRPDNKQGWGRLDMGDLFTAAVGRVFVDQTEIFSESGQVFELVDIRTVSASQPLRIVLAWTDAPGSTSGSAYNNDLDLEVLAGGATYLGNVFADGWSEAGGASDLKNNVESVFLPPATTSTFTVRVKGTNINSDGLPGIGDGTDQDFALYVFNASLQSPTGMVSLDADGYSCTGQPVVTVSDEDLIGAGTLSVEISSTTQETPEVLTLSETGPDTGVFTGTMDLAVGAPVPGDGILQVADGDQVTATYHDADDGSGTPADVSDTALVDCIGPAISGIGVEINVDGAVISWYTDEPADSTVEYGPTTALGSTAYAGNLVKIHSVALTGLIACTQYRFIVRSADAYDNEAEEDNNGLTFSFTTAGMVKLLDEKLDSDPGWTRTGDWEFADPAGACSDPSSPYSGSYVLGNDVDGDGCYPNNANYTLTTSNIVLPAGGPILLSFQRWLRIETGYDEGRIKIHDDTGWNTIYDTDDFGTVKDAAWTYQEFDLTTFAGKTIQILWQLDTDYSVTYGGWNIDDIVVTAPISCPASNQAPTCAINVDPTSGTAPLEVDLDASAAADVDGTVVRYIWDLDDGTVEDGPVSISHTYTEGGDYTIRLTVVDDDGAVGNCTALLPINTPPVACFVADSELIQIGETINFDASCSKDPDGTIASYEWDLGDGVSKTGALIDYQYPAAGVFEVRLIVTDDFGAVVISEPLEVIVNTPPVGMFTWAPEVPFFGQPVMFDASGSTDSDGEIKNFEWDFGDGQIVDGDSTPIHVFTSPGSMAVTLKVTDNWGGTDEVVETILVNAAPTAVISVVPAGPAAQGAPLVFDGSGSYDLDGEITAYLWDFQDGTTSTEATADKTFSCPGQYPVVLTVEDDQGALGTTQKTVYINNLAPTVDVGPDLPANEGEAVLFTAAVTEICLTSPLSYLWDFGDMAAATTLSATHSYMDDGEFTAQLCATDNMNGTGCDSRTVSVVNVAPVVDAGSDLDAGQGQQVEFQGSFTDPGMADTHIFDWDFGDGTAATGTLSPEHVYLATGPHVVTLTVTDDDGGVGTDTLTVTVGNGPPTVDAGLDQSGGEGQSFQFSGSASDPGGDVLTYHWDFGDGAAADGALTPQHTYVDDGTYLVILTATDAGGLAASDSLTVTVQNMPPVVDPMTPLDGLEGSPVTFTGTFADPGLADTHSFHWDFGDGTTSMNLQPNHSYKDDGEYSAVLQVTDNDGGSDFATVLVSIINVPPAVEAGGDKTAAQGQTLQFQGTFIDPGEDDTHSFHWDFGDGATSDGTLAPQHAYQAIGTHVVTLTVTDDDGGVGTDTLTVTVGNGPPLVNAGNDQSGVEGDAFQFSGSASDPGGDAMTFNWDFGDGTGADGAIVSEHTYKDEGTFIVTFTATDEGGMAASDALTVTVQNMSPVLDPIDPLTGLEGSAVSFSASFTDPGVEDTHSYLWDFGDGVHSTSLSTQHVYADNGTYTASLQVTDNSGAMDVESATVTIENVAPVADAGGERSGLQGQQIVFNGAASDPGVQDTLIFHWDFGDGGTAEGTLSPAHAYTGTEIYTVTLTVTDKDGAESTDTTTATIDFELPDVEAGSDQSGSEGMEFEFTGTAEDPGGADLTLSWDFGDGVTAEVDPANHSYADNGIYTVTFTATKETEDGEISASDTLTVTVTNAPPEVDPGGDITVIEGTAAAFAGTFIDPGTADTHSFLWVFGDGGTAATLDATHAYEDDGAYTAMLQVTDKDGAVDSGSLVVTVENASPVVNAGPDKIVDQSAQVAFQGFFQDPGAGDSHTFHWDFGDGAEVNDTLTPTHLFGEMGSYTVTLTVTDDDGGEGTDSLIVNVGNVPPSVEAGPNQSGDEGTEFIFNGQAQDPGGDELTFHWDFGDGSTTEGMLDPAHVFEDNGVFPVTLTVTDSNGGIGSDTMTVTVFNIAPQVDAGPSLVADEGDSVSFSGLFSDPGAGDVHEIEWNFGDGEAMTGELAVDHVFLDDGDYLVTLTVTDDDGGTGESLISVKVDNVSPAFLSEPLTEASQGEIWSYQAVAEDPAGLKDPLVFSLDVSPPSMIAQPDTGMISWTPGNGDVCVPHDVMLRVNDDDGGVAFQGFSIEVLNLNDPPEILSTPPVAAVQGYPYTYYVSVLDQDVDLGCTGDLLTYELIEAPDGMTVNEAGVISWTPSNMDIGMHTVLLQVSDSAGLFDEQGFDLAVTPDPLAPVAIAGPDRYEDPGIVVLDGSNSYPGVAIQGYQWSQLDGSEELDPASCQGPTCPLLMVTSGLYTFQLVVVDLDGVPSPPDTLQVTINNLAPTARAGYHVVVPVGAPAMLDGSMSGDINGDGISFLWDFVDMGGQDAPELDDSASPTPSFIPNEVGQYHARLVVSDGVSESPPSVVVVTAVDEETPDYPPVAFPLPEHLMIAPGQQFVIDGLPSYDPEGEALTYLWQQILGPLSIPISDPTDPVQELTVFQPGVFDISLVVDDGGARSLPAVSRVEVVSEEGLPESDPGPDLVLNLGESGVLDGTGSEDPLGGALAYVWKQTGGLSMPLDNPAAATPEVTGLWPGRSRFELTVTNDAEIRSAPSTVYVFVVSDGGSVPIASAGEDQVLSDPDLVTLDGSATEEPDGDALYWYWVQVAGPSVVLDITTPVKPTFAPPTYGMYSFDLVVSDGETESRPDNVTVLISGEENQPPIAEAGEDMLVTIGDEVVLDGSGSHDPEEQAITYSWSQVEGPEAALSDPGTAQPTFVPDMEGVYIFRLVVADDFFESEPDEVVVTVGPPALSETPPDAATPDIISGEDMAGFEETVGDDTAGDDTGLSTMSSPGDPGCGCRFHARTGSAGPSSWLVLALIVLLLARRRREV